MKAVFDLPAAYSDASNIVSVHVGPIDNGDDVAPAIESVQIYPNPVRSVSNITINGKANSPVKADIYNTKGQIVKSMNGKIGSNGFTNLKLNVSNDLIPGIYFVQIKSATGTFTNKIVLMK